MQSAREKKLSLDEKLEIGLISHNNTILRIKKGYTGKVIQHFKDGEIIFEEPRYKRKLK